MNTDAMKLAVSFVENGTLVIKENGEVWRHKDSGRPCEPRRAEHPDDKGYLRITLGIPGKNKTCHVQAHCLIWTVVNGTMPPGLQVNHKDLNKQNNRLDNLELTTGAGNIQHSYANGRPRPWHKATVWRGKPRITEDQKTEIIALRSGGMVYREIGQRFNIGITHVQRICAATGKEAEGAKA